MMPRLTCSRLYPRVFHLSSDLCQCETRAMEPHDLVARSLLSLIHLDEIVVVWAETISERRVSRDALPGTLRTVGIMCRNGPQLLSRSFS